MRSLLRRSAPELGLLAFIAVNAVAMLEAHVGQTVPFHFIWISLTIVYGYRTWTATWTWAALVAVCAVTTVSLLVAVAVFIIFRRESKLYRAVNPATAYRNDPLSNP